MIKFKIYYDTTPDDVVHIISSKLKEFGIEIVEGDGGDGWIEYKIVKIE